MWSRTCRWCRWFRWRSARWPAWGRRAWLPAITRRWSRACPSCSTPARRSSRISARRSARMNWAAARSTRATGWSTMRSTPRPRPLPVPGAFFRTCRPRSSSCRRAALPPPQIPPHQPRLPSLPTSVFELPPRGAAPAASADQQWLLAAIPRDARSVYKIRPIVQTLVDPDSFMELGGKWGRALATGLARIDGWPVAVLASDPYHYGGGWDRATSDKLIRFVDLAQVFHLPVVNLVDVAGFQIGVDAEKSGVMRSGVRALAAIYQTTVPWCSIIVRRAYGVAAAGHQHMGRHNWRYAWPSANWGSLPIEGGLEVAYKAEIEAAQDPGRKRAEIEQRLRRLTSPFRSAEAFVIEDIIDPRETRARLVDFVHLAARLRQPGQQAFGIRP